MGLDPTRSAISAQGLGARHTLFALQLAPAADAGGADAEALASLAMATGPPPSPKEPDFEDRTTAPWTCLPASDPADSFGKALRFNLMGESIIYFRDEV